MCGIIGVKYFRSNKDSIENEHSYIKKCSNDMKYRGPDQDGFWTNSDDMALAFRRLAIRDLTIDANQPMVSTCGNYVLVFNGELYGIEKYKKHLEQKFSHNFITKSDTEVLLYLLIYLGIKKTLSELDGIFAFGFYDRRLKKLVLARDRAGVKPIYYQISDNLVLFSSEYSHLMNHHSSSNNSINHRSVKSYLKFGYIPNGHGFYENSFSLPNGSYCEIEHTGKNRISYYYKYSPYTSSHNKGNIDKILSDAVDSQLVSDVDLGVFLSSGVDSTLISSYASRKKSLEAYTLDIKHNEYSEKNLSKAYVDHFGIKQNIFNLQESDLLSILHESFKAFSEPFCDHSSVATFLLSKMVAEKEKVVLSGDGADELFSGYSRNVNFFNLLTNTGSNWKKALSVYRNIFSNDKVSWRSIFIKDYVQFYIDRNSIPDGKYLSDYFTDSELLLPATIDGSLAGESQDSLLSIMKKLDYELHLPRILMKVDRASMYHSLEVRVPFLSNSVIDYAETSDISNDLSLETGKLQLKKLLSKKSKSRLPFNDKKGFGIPLKDWMHGELKRDIKEKVLDMDSSLSDIFTQSKLESIINKFYVDKSIHYWPIWSLYSLSSWYDIHRK